MQKVLETHSEAQRAFVTGDHAASAYMGGVGAGKTWGGVARGLRMAQQPIAPNTLYGPRGLIGAASFRVLRMFLVPQFMEILEGTGLWKTGKRTTSWVKSEMKARLVANCGCPNPHTCDHEVEIYLASLDEPNELRGLELSWFYIDEGRNTTRESWDVLWGRLRQQGYQHAGWVCSTPNSFDWMFDLFSEASPKRIPGARLFHGRSSDNPHLPEDYIHRLEDNYSGRFYQQEVEGLFVGAIDGMVFFEWDPSKAVEDVEYDPSKPLYSEWDFGYGDPTVVLFFQIDHVTRKRKDGTRVTLPVKLYVGAMTAEKRTSKEWAAAFKEYCSTHFGGRLPLANYGDPAGRQTNQVTGTSVVKDLADHGVRIAPAPRKPADFAVGILNNMMAEGRVKVDRTRCGRLSEAFAVHKWPTDASGQRTSNKPVHDWSSHWADAARYGTTVLFGTYAMTTPPVTQEFPRGSAGHLLQQLLEPDTNQGWLGPKRQRETDWGPAPVIVPRGR